MTAVPAVWPREYQAATAPVTDSQAQLDAVLRLTEGLVASRHPSVVFASLAELCVPAVSDACLFTVCEVGQDPIALYWPAAVVRTPAGHWRAGASEAQPRSQAVFTTIAAPTHAGLDRPDGSGYHGVFTLIWLAGAPGPQHALLARLLVDRAVSVLERERLDAELEVAHSRVENCEIALASSRTIGTAIGMLMERYKLTSSQAFDLLSRVSQARHHKLRDCANELVTTGELAIPDGVGTAG